ncbi:hypothetical protein [Bifidobacterium catenulatum]|uniref:hypothetical protein n=1 Tax=Bifidobacterium catenulatum TaxID=1686 RepID=UPI00130E9372|nr:hypothetical protein [Bifidobacterium catenulatum]
MQLVFLFKKTKDDGESRDTPYVTGLRRSNESAIILTTNREDVDLKMFLSAVWENVIAVICDDANESENI